MDELIQQITKQLGIDTATARSAVDKVAGMIKENATPEVYSQIAEQVPGFSLAAESEPASASDAPPASQGLFGSLGKLAASALGGSAGNTIELAGKLKDTGLPTDKIGDLVKMVIEFIKARAGEQVTSQLLAKFPMLKQFLT